MVKRGLVGRFRPGPIREGWSRFRLWLMRRLLPSERLREVSHMVGAHFEGVSMIMRSLGAKVKSGVGQRVYWPGSGLEGLVEYDLLQVGDDVVFGSRTAVLCSDHELILPIKIQAGANVADRCILLPGVTIERNAVLGTGGLGPRAGRLRAGSKWIGAQRGVPLQLDPGGAAAEAAETLRPYGRALGLGQATYRPIPGWAHGLVWMLFRVRSARDSNSTRGAVMVHLVQVIHLERRRWPFSGIRVPLDPRRNCSDSLAVTIRALTVTISLAWTATTLQLQAFQPVPPPPGAGPANRSESLVPGGGSSAGTAGSGLHGQAPEGLVGLCMVLSFVFVQNLVTLAGLASSIACKWVLIGRRTSGQFDWDQSNYCQRWQVFLATGSFLRTTYGVDGPSILDYLRGSVYLVWYFRALGCEIGHDVCLYPSGADPMMTEPDLVHIGDKACIDYAALIAHLNTQGRFSLGPIRIGARATLRRGARVLAGGSVLDGATLLEHTLVMSGDAADAGSIWQGWPATMVSAAAENRDLTVTSSHSRGPGRRVRSRRGGAGGEDDDGVEMLEWARDSEGQQAFGI